MTWDGLLFLLMFGLPSTLVAVAVFAGIWLSVGKRRPVLASLAILTIGLLPVAWLASLPREELGVPGAGFVYVALIGPVTLACVWFVAGLAVFLKRTLVRQVDRNAT